MAAQEVSAEKFLAQQGASFVCFHPQAEQLVLGLGCSENPACVPAVVAYRRKRSSDQQQQRGSSVTAAPPPREQQASGAAPAEAYEVLTQVQRLLHLPAPPNPSRLQQQQQQGAADPFPAAKAGLVSQQQVPEASDGFIWLDDTQQAKLLQQKQQQQQQQPLPDSSSQQQPQQGPQQGCFAGGQVPALWPPEDYKAHWLMTPDNHIAGLDSTPQHLLLDRFEAAWGWALQQLGLPLPRCRHLSAVLAVPIDMTAAEVRFLADLLLGRLGFSALVVHLEPVAASFGNGTTSACVVSVGSSCCTVCCIDDAVVLPPAASRLTLPVGLADVAGALTGWMSCYGHWPPQLTQQGLGRAFNGSGSSSSSAEDGMSQTAPAAAAAAAAAGGVSPADVYHMLLLEDLVLQQCYCPKESYQPGLAGQPMLEPQPPAVVPVRASGQPTTNYNVALGSWAAAASMALFFPGLAPAPAPAAAAAADGWLYRQYHSHALELPAAEALHLQSQLKARLEAGEAGPPPDGLYLLPLELTEQPVVGGVATAAGTPAPPAAGAAQPAESAGGSSGAGMQPCQPQPQQLQLQPHEAKSPAAAAAAGSGEAKPPAAAASSQGGGSTPGIGLDEAVFRSMTAAAAGRPELASRLAAGLLLIGPGGGLRGLAPALERRVTQRFTAARQPQVVFTLEPRAEPAQVTWKGAALLAALDAGSRENWLPRHQWLHGGHTLPGPPQPATASTGTGSNCTTAAGRHTKLFFYARAEQGVL